MRGAKDGPDSRAAAAADIFLRADSLMQRRRSFVATPRPPDEIDAVAEELPSTPAAAQALPAVTSAAPPAPADEDDLPVLTEVVPPEAVPVAISPAAREEALAHRLAADLAQALGDRLDAELPALIDAAWERVEDELRRGVRAIGEAALRDFLASRQPARPPAAKSD